MSSKKIIILLFSLVVSVLVNGQKKYVFTEAKEKQEKKTFIEKSILPASFILGGILISNSDFEKTFQSDVRSVVGTNFHYSIDDYTRYAPIIEMYAADIMGVEAKNHWFDQTKNLTIAVIVSDFITFQLKKKINKRRPDGGDDMQSFPSGHTSFAFTNASVLYQEFIDSSPLLAYSGYGFATITGSMRVVNNAHWLSDVLVGAGIGILVTELVYLLDPIIKWNPFKKVKNVSFIPQIDNKEYGFYLSYKF